MSIKIDRADLAKIQRKLGSLAKFHDWAREPMTNSLGALQDDIAKYPPKPAHSTYRRTDTLGRRWTSREAISIRRSGSGIKGTLGNNTEYAKYVQSLQDQTWFHAKTGWRTDENVIERQREKVNQIWSRAIKNELRSS